MSRVLARPMFKKKAPKRSSKGVGITSGLMDDVAGYAEGGEVTDDRTERERLARQLLERNRDENSDYQTFAEGERPQMYRPPATAPGMVPQPQPNPQQMQAMQMQRMAQMGMLPRFQEGGEVQAPSIWSRLSAPFRQRTGPILDPNTGEPAVFFNPDDPVDRTMGGIADVLALRATGGRMRFPRPPAGGGLEPSTRPGPWEIDRSSGPWSKPQPLPRRAQEPPPPEGGSVPSMPLPREGTSVPSVGRAPAPGAAVSRPPGLNTRAGATDVDSYDFERREATRERISDLTPPPSEERQAEMEMSRESARARGLSKLPYTPEKKAAPPLPPPPGADKKSSLPDIKAEREARKAELAAEADAARKENMWLALMQAGLAIAGGKSSNAITNIGQGGQAGLASFMALEQQRRRDQDAAMRRDLAEREYFLQERRLNMQEPYYTALTERQKMAPLIALQNQQRMMAVAQFNAEKEAGRAWDAHVKNNQAKFLGMPDATLNLERDIFIRENAKRLLKPAYDEIALRYTQGQRGGETSPEE